MSGPSWPSILSQLVAGESLSEEDAAACMGEIMDGAATPAQVAGFMVALRAKGETLDEVVGFVRAMRARARTVNAGSDVLDTCGTGGDRAGTFNVSTCAAIVCAATGVKVAKHGNRAASSRSGSADVLEALGVKIDLEPVGVETCIARAGIGFCFAPVFHPAMRHAVPTRRELGIPTIFNFLGPLANPAGATRQVIGISDPRMLEVLAGALRRLGSDRVLAFHGHGGLDELATSGPSKVLEVTRDETKSWTLDPQALGLPRGDVDDLKGGTPEENAAVIRSLLKGETGPRRDIVALNAAAGLLAAGRAESIEDGMALAAGAIDSGEAERRLALLVAVSNEVSTTAV